jgi:hypothetical protein
MVMSKLILAAALSFSFAGVAPNDDQIQIERAIARHFQPDAHLELEHAQLELSPETLHVRPARAAISAVLDR